MPGFTSLAHIALRANNLERTLDFYTNKLGCKEILRLNWQDGKVWLVYLRVTDTQYLEIFPDGVGIELMEMKPDCIQFEAVRRLEQGLKPVVVKTNRMPELPVV